MFEYLENCEKLNVTIKKRQREDFIQKVVFPLKFYFVRNDKSGLVDYECSTYLKYPQVSNFLHHFYQGTNQTIPYFLEKSTSIEFLYQPNNLFELAKLTWLNDSI